MSPLLRLKAVTFALMSGVFGNGRRAVAEPAPITALGQAGLPPAARISSSVFVHCGAPFESIFDPAGNVMSKLRTDFGCLLFAVLESSVEAVENVVPTDLFVLVDEYFWLYVWLVAPNAIAATARARAPTRTPMKSLRKLLSSSNRGNGPCAGHARRAGKVTLTACNPRRPEKFRGHAACLPRARPS